mgnify:CR=1 FL=1
MLIRELIEELDIMPNTCDTVKIGNPDEPIKGIVVTMWATPNVIKRAGELRANLIITHGPTLYSDTRTRRGQVCVTLQSF